MTKTLYAVISLFFIMMLHSYKNEKATSSSAVLPIKEAPFFKKIKNLTAKDSLSITSLNKVKIKFLFAENPEIDAEDAFRNANGYISLEDYKALRYTDVIQLTDRYVLVLLRHKLANELRAATLKGDGTPIETILLHDRLGNNEYKISRTFLEEEEPSYNYDSTKNEFTFTDLRYDTERITFPTEGEQKETYRIVNTIGITENGAFWLKEQKEL